ncbi:MAG: hypothetical protein GTO22_21605, partial [Gemmatimonadales bacterium]|nr:hypothetical protein [Gemmatimonadales bacterium]
MLREQRSTTGAYLAAAALAVAILASTVWANGTVTGDARMEVIKGQPQMGYKWMFEWNLFLSPGSSSPLGPHRRVGGDTGEGDYTVEDMPAGTYSIIVSQPLWFLRPKVVPNVTIQDGQTTTLNIDMP